MGLRTGMKASFLLNAMPQFPSQTPNVQKMLFFWGIIMEPAEGKDVVINSSFFCSLFFFLLFDFFFFLFI